MQRADLAPADHRRVDLRRFGRRCACFVAGQAWQRGFFSRFPHLNVRLSKGQSRARLVNFNRISVADWYSHVEKLLAEFAPEEILNMDDVGYDLEKIKELVRTDFAP